MVYTIHQSGICTARKVEAERQGVMSLSFNCSNKAGKSHFPTYVNDSQCHFFLERWTMTQPL